MCVGFVRNGGVHAVGDFEFHGLFVFTVERVVSLFERGLEVTEGLKTGSKKNTFRESLKNN